MKSGKEPIKRLYIVSFGNSRQYRLEFDDVDNYDAFHHTNPLAKAEKELTDFLRKEFPGEPVAYYVTPKVTEVYWKDRDKYASYPVLDDEAVDRIKATLKHGVEDMDQTETINSDAPYATIENDNS